MAVSIRPRARIGVAPDEAFQSRRQLFDALSEAFGVDFGPTLPGAHDAAMVVFGPTSQRLPPPIPVVQYVGGGVQVGRLGTVRLSDSQSLPPPLRRRSLTHQGSGAVLPVESGEDVLAAADRGAVWTRRRGLEWDRLAVWPDELPEGGRLRDRFVPGDCLSLLALVVLAIRVAASHGTRRPRLRASIIVDDPNLHRPTYGFIDVRRLAELARTHGYHVVFATIPLDGWLADRRILPYFLGTGASLSLAVHGNNHLHRELARETSNGLAELAQAARRIGRLERRTGIPIPLIMVPPHGACSHASLTHMSRLGFEAACMSSVDTAAVHSPRLCGFRPAEMVDGLPVLPRHHMGGDREDFVLRALLGQPLIAYGHHTDVARGLDAFTEIAAFISSLGDVRWTTLADIARSNVEVVAGDSRTDVRLFSRDALLEVEAGETIAVDVVDRACDVQVIDGTTTHRGPGPHVIGEPRIRVVSVRRDAIAPEACASPAWHPWPPVRRGLTEARDRLQPVFSRRLRSGNHSRRADS